jgi:hypothetical protein
MMIDALLYFPFSIFIFLLYFLPGFLIIRFFKKFDGLEKLVLGFVLSTLIIFTLGLIVHILGFEWNFFTLFIPIIILILILSLIKRNIKIDKEAKFLLIIFFALYLFKLLILINIEIFPIGGDWIFHYDLSKIFLAKDWSFSTDRTILYNFILAFFMAIFRSEYWCTQITSVLLNSLILLPTYLIGIKLFNKKIATLSIFLLSITPYTHWLLYTWSKCFAGFFILIIYYFILKRKLNVFVGISAGLSFLVHQFSLLYLIPAVFLVIYKRKEFNLNHKKFLVISTPIIILFLSWFLYNFFVYGSAVSTIFKYYPIAVNGFETLSGKTSQQIWEEFLETPIYKPILTRIINAAIPTIPLIFIIPKLISIYFPFVLPLYKSIDFTQIPWTYHHFQTFAGHVSLLLYFFFCIGFFKLFKDKTTKKDLLILIIGPFILSLFLFGWILPITTSTLLSLIPLLPLIGFWEVEKSKNKNKWILIIFALAILETIIFSYWFGLHVQFSKQVMIHTGNVEYTKLLTVFKIFRY